MRDEAVLDMAERGLSTSAPRGTSMPQMSLLLGGSTWSHRGLGQGSSSCWDPWHVPIEVQRDSRSLIALEISNFDFISRD